MDSFKIQNCSRPLGYESILWRIYTRCASFDLWSVQYPEVVSMLYIQTSQWSVLIAEFVIIFLMFVMRLASTMLDKFAFPKSHLKTHDIVCLFKIFYLFDTTLPDTPYSDIF